MRRGGGESVEIYSSPQANAPAAELIRKYMRRGGGESVEIYICNLMRMRVQAG